MDDWDLLPHGTIQYLLVPNAVLVHQIDHLELWRLTPLAPDRTIVRTSIYSPGPPASEKARRYFVKNLDVLLGTLVVLASVAAITTVAIAGHAGSQVVWNGLA